jgi:hypothetical protein
MIIKNLFTMVGLMLLFQTVNAQINAVQYQLRFNETTNLFDCYLLIKDGNAYNENERIQFNSQYTLIVPANSAVQLVKTYNPLLDNKSNSGSRAQQWTISNISAKPSSDRQHDYISIVPALTPTAFYNNLSAGDEIKLFSINIQPVTNCGADVKLFENGLSLSSSAKGLRGGDYSNGFTMGGVDQIYQGNAPQVIPSLNVINNITTSESKSKNKIHLDLVENNKFAPYNFVWTGPNKFSAYTKDLENNVNSGLYTVEITDSRGCKQTKSIDAKFNNVKHYVDVKSDLETELRRSTATSIDVYPNPANNFVNVAIKGENGTKVAIDITDINGKVVQANVLNTTLTSEALDSNIDIQNITPGIYNLSVSMDEKVSSHKLIIIR